MQGQEADAVLVSYGVCDPEYALQEAAFIYGLNRLNVAITLRLREVRRVLARPLVGGYGAGPGKRGGCARAGVHAPPRRRGGGGW